MASTSPTMSYWHTVEVNAHANAVTAALFYICCGIFFYDSVLSAPFDCSVLFGKRKLRWVHLSYFGTKLAFWAYAISAFVIIWSKHEIDCQANFRALEFFMGMTVFASSCLLAFRTYCVFHGREQKIVLALIAFLATGLLAAWMQGVNDVQSSWKADRQSIPYVEGYCVYDGISRTYWVKYVITIVFDLSILIMTTIGISRMASGSKIGTTLVNQGILFFVFTFLANLLITIFTLLQLSPTMSLICAMSQSTICVICSTYLHRSLAQQKTETPASSHFTDKSLVGSQSGAEQEKSCCRLTNLPFVGRFLFAKPCVEAVSCSQGTIPTFVSGTTCAVNRGLDSPYPKSLSVLSPRAEHADVERGYFDIVAGSSTPGDLTPAVLRRASRQQLDFADMLREGPQRSSTVRVDSAAPRTILSTESSPQWIRVDVEQSVQVESRSP